MLRAVGFMRRPCTWVGTHHFAEGQRLQQEKEEGSPSDAGARDTMRLGWTPTMAQHRERADDGRKRKG